MQLIRNCTGEIHAKTCNCDLIGCFCSAKVVIVVLIGYFSHGLFTKIIHVLVMQNLVIVRDWIILADDHSIAFDFRTPNSIFYVMSTCFFSLMQ